MKTGFSVAAFVLFGAAAGSAHAQGCQQHGGQHQAAQPQAAQPRHTTLTSAEVSVVWRGCAAWGWAA